MIKNNSSNEQNNLGQISKKILFKRLGLVKTFSGSIGALQLEQARGSRAAARTDYVPNCCG